AGGRRGPGPIRGGGTPRSGSPGESRPCSLLPREAHGLNVVAVGIDQERREIGRPVVGAQPRRAVVAPARGETLLVEALHRRAIRRAEREVRAALTRARRLREPEPRAACRAEAPARRVARRLPVPPPPQRR